MVGSIYTPVPGTRETVNWEATDVLNISAVTNDLVLAQDGRRFIFGRL